MTVQIPRTNSLFAKNMLNSIKIGFIHKYENWSRLLEFQFCKMTVNLRIKSNQTYCVIIHSQTNFHYFKSNHNKSKYTLVYSKLYFLSVLLFRIPGLKLCTQTHFLSTTKTKPFPPYWLVKQNLVKYTKLYFWYVYIRCTSGSCNKTVIKYIGFEALVTCMLINYYCYWIIYQ